jgi:hypothetical protein
MPEAFEVLDEVAYPGGASVLIEVRRPISSMLNLSRLTRYVRLLTARLLHESQKITGVSSGCQECAVPAPSGVRKGN